MTEGPYYKSIKTIDLYLGYLVKMCFFGSSVEWCICSHSSLKVRSCKVCFSKQMKCGYKSDLPVGIDSDRKLGLISVLSLLEFSSLISLLTLKKMVHRLASMFVWCNYICSLDLCSDRMTEGMVYVMHKTHLGIEKGRHQYVCFEMLELPYSQIMLSCTLW